MSKKHVVISCVGGVAELAHASGGVQVRIVDWDNLEHLSQAQKDAYERRLLKSVTAEDERFIAQQQADQVAICAAIGVAQWARDNGGARDYLTAHIKQLRKMRRRIIRP